MKIFDKIVLSDNEPSTNSLWIKDGKMAYYRGGGWKQLAGGDDNQGGEVPPPEIDLSGYLTTEEGDGRYLSYWRLVRETMASRVSVVPVVYAANEDGVFGNGYPVGIIYTNTRYNTSAESSKPLELEEYLYQLRAVASITGNLETDYSEVKNLVTADYLHSKFISREQYSGLFEGSDVESSILNKDVLPSFTRNYDTKVASILSAPVSIDSKGLLNVYVYNGTRDLNASSRNIVTEEGLYKEFEALRGELYHPETNLLRSALLPVPSFNYLEAAAQGNNPLGFQSSIVINTRIFTGSRDINPEACNLVTEKGLSTTVERINSKFLDDKGLLRKSLIPLGTSNVAFDVIDEESPITFGRLSLTTSVYNGERDLNPESGNLVQEKGLCKALEQIQEIQSFYWNTGITVDISSTITDKTSIATKTITDSAEINKVINAEYAIISVNNGTFTKKILCTCNLCMIGDTEEMGVQFIASAPVQSVSNNSLLFNVICVKNSVSDPMTVVVAATEP